MNFLRDKSLKQLGIYLLVLMILLLLGQYSVVQYKLNQLRGANLKIDFARSTQSFNQKLFLHLQFYLAGKKEQGAQIAALINDQDHRLNVLSQGGRIDGTENFVSPLSRLPQITFQGLKESWEEYKKSAFVLLSPAAVNSISSPQIDSVEIDSASNVIQTNNPEYYTSRVRHEGLALTLTTWYDKLIVDLNEEANRRSRAITVWMIFFIFFNGIILAGIYFLFIRKILLPLKIIRENTVVHKHTFGLASNEIGSVATAVNDTIENLKDASDFVVNIGQGNLAMDYKQELDINYQPGSNILADSLIAMQGKLRTLNEEEQKRQWANEGLAKFVDILRGSNDNLTVLCDKIISALVHYTKSNQGGLYILNDEDDHNKFLELISLFAFDTKKYEQQKIKPGEGILGQTFLERETTYLTHVPEEYVRITSGLGGATPKAILIVPLKVDQHVYGLVELASFNEYQPHEVAFVEKLGETIASTLANVRSAQKNRHLIEQFQQQTEEMRAQEEEMRQNMEELQATQEEIARKEKSYLARIAELESMQQTGVSIEEIQSAKDGFKKKEREYHIEIEQLRKELMQKLTKNEDWETAQELSRALKINLEALKITQEELDHSLKSQSSISKAED